MRIAFVTETYPPELNGVSLTVKRCEAFLRRCGHEVEMIRPRQPHENASNNESQWLAPGMRIPVYPDLRFGFPATARLLQRWRKRRPHVVHIVTEGPLGWSANRAARLAGIPATSDFRTNFHQYSRYYPGLGWMENAIVRYFRSFHNRTATTFVPTVALRDELATSGFLNLEVVGRGVDTQRFDPRKRSSALRRQWGVGVGGVGVGDAGNAGSDVRVMLYVGRLAAEKNMRLVFEAARRARAAAPDTRLVVVGDGPMRKALQRDHPDAVFMGRREGEELAAIYASADIFLFPSLTDTFGNVVLEAMASGLAIVAFDRGAAREHLHSLGPSCGLLPSGDDEGFIAAACALACRGFPASFRSDAPGFAALRQRTRQLALAARWDEVLGHFHHCLAAVAAREPLNGKSDESFVVA